MPIRVTDGRARALRDLLENRSFRDEFRELLGLYDLELQYKDSETNDPKQFIQSDGDDFYIRFRPYEWEAKREAERRQH